MYQRILNSLQDFFGISRKEARGALVMMLFCLMIIWSPFFFRRWILPFVLTGSPPPERKMLDSIALLLEKQQVSHYRGKSRSLAYETTPPAEAIKLTGFDPNTASEKELLGVGIPAFIANRIAKFRSKGGQFRRKEDLLKIYDFPQDLYTRLKKYIVIPAEQESAQTARNGFPKPQSNAIQEDRRGHRVFDINQCDTTTLISLKGIGSKLAQRILKYRDGLGGFYSTDQFNEVYGLDSLALSELKRYAKVGSPVRKININTATAEELGRHPYLRNRKQVQVLINYRTQHGPFRLLEELRNVKVLDEATVQKTGPYLSF